MPDINGFYDYKNSGGGDGDNGQGGGGSGSGCLCILVVLIVLFAVHLLISGAGWDAVDSFLGFAFLAFLFIRYITR